MTYSYNPLNVGEFGLDRIRFELGDVDVSEPEKTAYLTDEEITAVLDSSNTFKRAKFRLVESLLHRFAYEVDTKIKEADWKLSQRISAWQKIYTRLKAEVDAEETGGAFGFTDGKGRPPVFEIGMHDWRRG